eukprot:3122738-Prymnesium_polylepis.1
MTDSCGLKSGSPTEREMICLPSRRSAAALSVTATVLDKAIERTRRDSCGAAADAPAEAEAEEGAEVGAS